MDREQVIKGMEEVVRDFKEEIEEWGRFTPDEMRGGISVDCDWYYGVMQKCEAGLELLKQQEPVKAIRYYHTENKHRDHYRCPICKADITYEQNYCSECGRAMAWE